MNASSKAVRVVVLVLALAGCSSGAEPTSDGGGIAVHGAGGAATARSIVMPDGTRCVALVGYYKAGISCDWSQP